MTSRHWCWEILMAYIPWSVKSSERERESVCRYLYRDANRNQDNSRKREALDGVPSAKESQRTGGNGKSTPLEADHPGTRGQILFRSTACI